MLHLSKAQWSTLEMISLCKRIFNVENNKVGVEGIRWLARAKWSSINQIELGKTDQN
jgi:hypothetical protein